MERYIEPENSDEIIWMTLSLLILPPEEQIKIIGGKGEDRSEKLKNAGHILGMLFDFCNGWLDEMHPNTQNAEKLFEYINNRKFEYSVASFIDGNNWNELRKLAKLTLEESGFEPWPLPKRIKFSDYSEFAGEE